MEEESSKVSQEQKTSDEKSSKAVQFNQNTKSGSNKNSFSVDSSTSKTKSSKRFRDFLIGSEFLDSESDSKNKYLDEPRKQKVNQKYEDNTPSKSQEFYLRQEFMKFKIYRHIHSKKEQIIRIIGGLVGVLFIIAGILYLFGGSIRLADSVIYGERQYYQLFNPHWNPDNYRFIQAPLVNWNFSQKIHSELEKVEEPHSIKKSSKRKEKSFNEKKNKKNNIERRIKII